MLKSLVKNIVGERFVWAVRYLKYPDKFDIVGGKQTYKQDGLATAHNSDTLSEKIFEEAYQLAKDTGSFNGTWGSVEPKYRTYIYCWAAYKGKDLEGDYVECGVNKGGMARAAMHYSGFTNTNPKKFYLLDTYEGTPEHFLDEKELAVRNIYEQCYDDVVENFKDFPNVEIVRGEVPATLAEVKSEKVCFLSLDMNCVDPEIEAIKFFWDKLSAGAVVVLDDYNNIGHERQKEAFDLFAKDKGIKVMSLPTGQGLIFKN